MKCIVEDYEKLIPLKIKIPIYSGEIIEFSFRTVNLPHLLGLNKLVDIELFSKFANKEDEDVTASTIFRMMKNNEISMELIKSSSHFNEIYESKIKYFSSDNILKTLKNNVIIKFNPISIKDFDTKLDKVDYMFYHIVIEEEGHYYHFGIGFSTDKGGLNFPNTFFVRGDDTYIRSEEDKVFPTSIYIKNYKGKNYFHIYWSNIRKCLIQTRKVYKKLKKVIENNNLDMFSINKENIYEFNLNEDDLKIVENDFAKLRRDEVYEAYKPHIKFQAWDNTYKDYLIRLIDNSEREYLPNEVMKYFNEINAKDKKI